VLARSGGSVWELAAAGKPAILVPYPFATADHQTKNARFFVDAGGAVLVPQAELERVPGLVRSLLADPQRLAAMRDAMLHAAKPDAAEAIASELIELAEARRLATPWSSSSTTRAGRLSSSRSGCSTWRRSGSRRRRSSTPAAPLSPASWRSRS